MDEILLREVITKVLSDPNIQRLLEGGIKEPPANKPECLVVVENEVGLRGLLDLEHSYGLSYDLRLCVLDNKLLDASSLSQISYVEAQKKKSWNRMLIPVCSAGQLAQIALGLNLDKISELTAWAIKNKIPVEIGWVDYGFTEQTPQAYCDLFTGYAKQAASYGVVISKQQQVNSQSVLTPAVTSAMAPIVAPSMAVPGAPALGVNSPVNTRSEIVPWSFTVGMEKEEHIPQRRQEIAFNKRLFSAKQAMVLPPYAILRVAKATVLTPSALDTLKNNKIEVYREGVQCL